MAGGEVKLVDLVKQFGDVTAVDGINLQMPAGEFFSMLGPSGLRQDHHAADDRGLRAADQRPDPAGRRRHGLHAAAQAQRQHRVPELRAVPAPVGAGQRGLRPAPPEDAQERGQAAGRRGARAGAADRPRAAQAGADVGRPAAAGGAGTGAGAEAGGAAAGRAAGRARRQAAKGAADRAEDAAAAGRHHLHLRHPRPGRGAHHERPHRRHERRPGRAGGRAERGLRGAVHHLRGRLPGRLQPDGGDRPRRERRPLPGHAGRVRAAGGPRRHRHHAARRGS